MNGRAWEIEEADTDLDVVERVFDMLIGKELPEGVCLEHQPNLTEEEAFSVVWFLQEVSRVLPDTIDRCNYCGLLYNAECTSPGYIDDTDDWFWKETEFTEDEIKSVAHQHFCSWGCMSYAIQYAQES
jgi:hypothetical protein